MSQTYSVRSGDTVSELAQRFGVDETALMRANGMDPALADGRVGSRRADPDRLQVGQRLTIPSATAGYERSHSVQAGDTLTELAARWGVSLESLLAANPQFDASRADGRVDTVRGARGTWDPDALRIGDTLRRPGAAAPAAPAEPPAAGGAGGTGSNAILDGIDTSGASSRTARQDGLGGGVAASHTMARTDQARVMRYADRFERAAARYDLPPALLAAIASRESRGGNALDGRGYGDAGHGFGLMQVDDRNPGLRVATEGGPAGQAHIDQAASILRAKLDAVQRQHPELSEKDQLRLAVSRYNGGSGVPGNFDRGTTGGDYSADVIARAQYYAARWPGAAPSETPAVAGAGLPATARLSEAQKFDLYAQRINAAGDANARADLAAGRRVILGLRVDTAVDANGGIGRYDDRIAVLWKDANGTKHVLEVDAATEPSGVYYDRGYGSDINGDGRRELGRLREGTLQFNAGSTSRFAQALIPASALPVTRDTNHDNRINSSDSTSNTGNDFLFHKGGRGSYTGSAGCQTIPPAQWNDFWNALGGQRHFNYVLVNVTPS